MLLPFYAHVFIFICRRNYRILRLIRWMVLIFRIRARSGIECSCSEGRDYSTSFPVRYIPKKSSKYDESVASAPTKSFQDFAKLKEEKNVERTKLNRGGEAPSRNFLFYDQEPLSSISPGVDTEINGDMLSGDEYMEEPKEFGSEVECNLMQHSKGDDKFQVGGNREEAEKLVLQWLASRAYTAEALRKKLQGKRFPLNVVDAVITDFENRGFINDCLYAESFSRSRWSSSCWGPRRIKQALFEKGIKKEDAENAINMVFNDGNCGEDHEARHGMSKLSMDHLLTQVSKQWLKSHGLARDKRNSRLVRWLQYRGFNWSVINFVLKKLESEYPP